MLNSQGNIWKEQRAFMVKTLNSLVLRNSGLQDMISEEVERFCGFLEEKKGTPVQVVGLFDLSVFSILWKMTTGKDANHQDSKLKALRQVSSHSHKRSYSKMSSAGLHAAVGYLGTPEALFSAMFPWVTTAFPNATGLKRHKDFYRCLCGEIQDIIKTHKKDLDVDNPVDLIDYFLIKMEKKRKVIDLVNIEEEEEKLRTLVIYIFIVSMNLSFAFTIQ